VPKCESHEHTRHFLRFSLGHATHSNIFRVLRICLHRIWPSHLHCIALCLSARPSCIIRASSRHCHRRRRAARARYGRSILCLSGANAIAKATSEVTSATCEITSAAAEGTTEATAHGAAEAAEAASHTSHAPETTSEAPRLNSERAFGLDAASEGPFHPLWSQAACKLRAERCGRGPG